MRTIPINDASILHAVQAHLEANWTIPKDEDDQPIYKIGVYLNDSVISTNPPTVLLILMEHDPEFFKHIVNTTGGNFDSAILLNNHTAFVQYVVQDQHICAISTRHAREVWDIGDPELLSHVVKYAQKCLYACYRPKRGFLISRTTTHVPLPRS